ncbi:MAG: hypothetical protein WB643_02670 [Candidatus Bathyarchaeia archaeon]
MTLKEHGSGAADTGTIRIEIVESISNTSGVATALFLKFEAVRFLKENRSLLLT